VRKDADKIIEKKRSSLLRGVEELWVAVGNRQLQLSSSAVQFRTAAAVEQQQQQKLLISSENNSSS
jgi:hypothetical protein